MTNPVPNSGLNVNVPQVTSPFLTKEGLVDQAWLQFLITLWRRTGGLQGEGPDLQYSETLLLGQITELQARLDALAPDPGNLIADLQQQIESVAQSVRTVDTASLQEQIDSLFALAPSLQGLVATLVPASSQSGWSRHFMLGGM